MIIILICILILLIVNFYYHNCEEYEEIDPDLKECINKIDAFKQKWNDDKIKRQKQKEFDINQKQLQDLEKLNAFKDQIISIESDTNDSNGKYKDLLKKIPIEKNNYEICVKNLEKENKKLISPTNCTIDNENQITYLNNRKIQLQNEINNNNNYTGQLNNNLNMKNSELDQLIQNIENSNQKIKTLQNLL